MYEVIRYFTDAQDNEYAYHEGDIYPRDGLKVSEKRINDLLSGNNFQQVALIRLSDGKPKKPEKVQEDVAWTAEEIQKMPFMKLKSVAKQNGVIVEDKKAADIKAELIQKLEL